MGEPDNSIVHRWKDIPRFSTEAEERTFWDTHTPAASLFTRRGPRPGSEAERLSRRQLRPHATLSGDDAIYVYLAWGRRGASKNLDAARRVDYAVDGTVTGVQFLNVHGGIDLRGVPERRRVKELLNELDLNLRIVA